MAFILNELSASIISEAVYQELTASHTYKHLANYMQRIGYFGASKYFQNESANELEHYQKHVEFINNMGGVVSLPALEEITETFSALKSAIQYAYNMELNLLQAYHLWYSTLLTKQEIITAQHLLQFIQIQQEAVGEYGDLLSRVAVVEGDTCGLLLIDQEMGK